MVLISGHHTITDTAGRWFEPNVEPYLKISIAVAVSSSSRHIDNSTKTGWLGVSTLSLDESIETYFLLLKCCAQFTEMFK